MSDFKVLVVDDHALTRQGIVMTINAIEGFEVIDTLSGGVGVVEIIQKNNVDITVLDLDIPGADGMSLLAELCGGLDATVVVLSGTGRTADFERAIRTGARAVVSKADEGNELVKALVKARDGERYVAPAVAALLDARDMDDVSLSPRQVSILNMLNSGETNKEIGYKLGIAAPTVSFHLAELRGKLSAESNRKIVLRAKDLGLI